MDDITLNNINSVRYQIGLKMNYNVPYYATQKATGAVVTDMDHFPYKRYFRGVYDQQMPIVMEREAGFRERRDRCYTQNSLPVHIPANYCWEYPCSSVPSCNAKKDDKSGDCKRGIVIAP
jgi:hypothetical protein